MAAADPTATYFGGEPFDKNNNVAGDLLQLIGQTPMVWLTRMNTTKAKIALKLEGENPMASVKDRLALSIILNAEKEGKITPGKTTLIEATSGNTGIALAQIGAVRGYKVILTMPDTMSQERRCLLSLFGADVRLTPGALGMKGAVAYALKLAKQIPDTYLCDQFATQYNAIVHKLTTGPEIWRQTKGNVDYFVAGVGTGGTITGVAQYLKEVGATTKIYAVEPQESAVISGEKPGPHKIQGIGAGMIPDVLDTKLIDGILKVKSEEAFEYGRQLPLKEGIFAGISAGAAVKAALELGSRPEAEGKTIVAIIPSFGERYLSTMMFSGLRDEVAKWPTVPAEEVTA